MISTTIGNIRDSVLLAQFDSPIDRSIPHNTLWQFSHHGIELILRFLYRTSKSRSLTLNKTLPRSMAFSLFIIGGPSLIFISATASKGDSMVCTCSFFLQYYFYTLVHIWHLQKKLSPSIVVVNVIPQLLLQPHYSHRQCWAGIISLPICFNIDILPTSYWLGASFTFGSFQRLLIFLCQSFDGI
jgi:hypothetical protein